MTKQDQIKELAEVIRKDYPEVNAEHIATIAVEWIGNKFVLFRKEWIDLVEEVTFIRKDDDYKIKKDE